MMEEPDVLTLADLSQWKAWLEVNEATSDGVWLLMAKKGTTSPMSLRYDEALEEALCGGWIDGQRKGIDAATFRQRFTPRRKASLWSQRNITLVARLLEEDRMRQRGQADIDRAQADGRWQRAYPGPATAEVPDDLAAALAASPAATAVFATLTGQTRYALLHRILTAPSESSRRNRLTKLVGGLAEEETPYPQ